MAGLSVWLTAHCLPAVHCTTNCSTWCIVHTHWLWLTCLAGWLAAILVLQSHVSSFLLHLLPILNTYSYDVKYLYKSFCRSCKAKLSHVSPRSRPRTPASPPPPPRSRSRPRDLASPPPPPRPRSSNNWKWKSLGIFIQNVNWTKYCIMTLIVCWIFRPQTGLLGSCILDSLACFNISIFCSTLNLGSLRKSSIS